MASWGYIRPRLAQNPHRVTSKAVRAVLAALRPGGYHHSCAPRRRSPVAVARYLFKHVTNPVKKAELPPRDFGGKLFTASRGYFVKPFPAIWKDVKRDWQEQAAERARRRATEPGGSLPTRTTA